jgi:signal transduction histidine kinase
MLKKGLLVASCLLLSIQIVHAELRDKLSQYVYEDTKRLVVFVEDAAALIEKNGEKAFTAFEKDPRWHNDTYYLFVYDINGNCIYHPIEKELVGKNLLNFRDIDGRPVIQMITDIGKNPAKDASEWAFYKWEAPWLASFPQWKSSYIRKVIAPDGKVYLIGSGLYNMKIEKVFVEQQVDKAADVLLTEGGKKAFSSLKYPFLNFDILDSCITVINGSGEIEVSPDFPSLRLHQNIFNIVDKAGRNVGRETEKNLQDKDRIWTSYLWPKEDPRHMARKLAYIRKVNVGGETLYVVMDFFPALPIWMK